MRRLKENTALFLAAATLLLIPLAIFAALRHAPIEVEMGVVQKIFYLHLPVALGSFAAFFVNFVASIGYLVLRRPGLDRYAMASAEVGLLLATLTLASGSIWARPIWNTWWNWEPRLTTMLLLWFLYLGYHVLRGSVENPGLRYQLCAVWGILAFADVPLVYFSVHWFERQLHPVVMEPGRGIALEPRMIQALYVCFLAFGALIAALIMLRARIAALEAAAGDEQDAR